MLKVTDSNEDEAEDPTTDLRTGTVPVHANATADRRERLAHRIERPGGHLLERPGRLGRASEEHEQAGDRGPGEPEPRSAAAMRAGRPVHSSLRLPRGAGELLGDQHALQGVEVLQHATGAPHHAGQRVVGDVDRHLRRVGDPTVQSGQQRHVRIVPATTLRYALNRNLTIAGGKVQVTGELRVAGEQATNPPP